MTVNTRSHKEIIDYYTNGQDYSSLECTNGLLNGILEVFINIRDILKEQAIIKAEGGKDNEAL